MSAFEETAVAHVLEERVPHGLGGRWYGVYPALVSDVRDPDGLGRVKVTLPWSPDASGDRYEAWARVATLMAGGNRGTWFIPDIDDEVLVAFEHGDPRWPHVVGGLWNGRDAPPESMDGGGKNALKVIRSRNGVKITLDDTDGRERLVIETPGGQKVTLADGPSSIELADANGNVVRMEASGITLSTGTKLTIQAGTVEISSATVTVNAGMSQFNGAAQANTVITPSVVGASYTPGAGNIW